MTVKIGSARSSYGNTSPGDQHNGQEVSTQNWYLHSLGWRVFRARDAVVREKLALAMERACANNNIGYSQATRNTLTDNVKPYGYDPAKTTKKVNTDCSALVRCCCLYAGVNVPDFYTANESTYLLKSGAFDELKGTQYQNKPDYLKRGDILNTKSKGHTVIVLSNGEKAKSDPVIVKYELGDRELSNGDEGNDVKQLQTYLIQLGYDLGSYGADGDFGDMTEMSVRAFQQTHGLDVDGIVGVQTLTAIYKILNDDPGKGKTLKIVNGDCYIRSEGSTKGKILGVALKGTEYVVEDTNESGWHMIRANGVVMGWVSPKYSEIT